MVSVVCIVQSWQVWYEQGVTVNAGDMGPISGMTASCEGPNNLTASLQVRVRARLSSPLVVDC